MTLKEFVEEHGDDPQGFCPCVIDVQGNLYDCAKGHLEALLKLCLLYTSDAADD